MAKIVDLARLIILVPLFWNADSHAAFRSWDECFAFGKTAAIPDVLRYARAEPPYDIADPDQALPSPCLCAVVRGFQHNHLVTGRELQTLLSIFKERADPSSYVGQMREMVRESSRFLAIIVTRISSDASKLLSSSPDFDVPGTREILEALPRFLSSVNDPTMISLIERILPLVPSDELMPFFHGIVTYSLLGEKMNREPFINQFKNRSASIFEFLDEMSWFESMEILSDQFHRGWAPQTDSLILAIQHVLKSDNPERSAIAVNHLLRFTQYAGTQGGQSRNVAQILTSLKLRRSLTEARARSAGELQKEIDRVLAVLDDFVQNRREFAARADQELRTCVAELTKTMKQVANAN